MQATERHSLAQIEGLNQRGGRTLSIVDLLQAGTVSAELAAYVGEAVGRGASLLTAANPGGAGKTALLAALLAFLPEGRPIVTVEDAAVLAEEAPGPRCYLAHEIGAGHWYGYLWGPVVARYVALAGPHTVASCLHADTYEELRAQLTSPPLAVPLEALVRVNFLLFMHAAREARGYRRRVAEVYECDGAGGHRCIFQWDPGSDTHRRADSVALGQQTQALSRFLADLAAGGACEYPDFRQRLLAFRQHPVGRF